ncbi:MAG: hypothetical protein QM613_06580 [Micrococcaceae bacterium]
MENFNYRIKGIVDYLTALKKTTIKISVDILAIPKPLSVVERFVDFTNELGGVRT